MVSFIQAWLWGPRWCCWVLATLLLIFIFCLVVSIVLCISLWYVETFFFEFCLVQWDKLLCQWICMYVHTYLTNLCKYVFMYVGTYVHTSIWRNVGTCVRVYVNMYVRMYVCIYVCIYVCMYLCMYICMYVFMYVFIQGVTGGKDQTSGGCSLC